MNYLLYVYQAPLLEGPYCAIQLDSDELMGVLDYNRQALLVALWVKSQQSEATYDSEEHI